MTPQFKLFEVTTYVTMVLLPLAALAQGTLTPSKLCSSAIALAICIANSLEARPHVARHGDKFRIVAFTLIPVWFAISLHGACTP